MARKRIGEVLLERGLITAPQLDAALGHQRHGSGRIGTTLVALGALSEGQLTATLGELQGLQLADLAREIPDWRALHLLRAEFCEKHLVLPLALEEARGKKQLRLAVADALDLPTLDAIEYQANCSVRPVLAGASQIRAAIARYYRGSVPGELDDLSDAGEMMLIRPGGATEVVQTDTSRLAPVLLVDEDFEVEEAEVLPLHDELDPPSVRSDIIRTDYEFLFGPPPKPADRLAELEQRVEGLARLLEKKGICSRHELEAALGRPLAPRGHA
jgi:hypothetical protein